MGEELGLTSSLYANGFMRMATTPWAAVAKDAASGNASSSPETPLDDGTRSCNRTTESVTCFMQHAVLPCFYALITLIGLVGNGMVIYVILSKQKMRTVTNLLLLNLAVADLLFVLICPPFTAIVSAMSSWPLGSVLCKLMHYLLNVTVYVTIYTLVIICIIRYVTIVHGMATSRFRTRNNIIVIGIAIWAVMLFFNSPIITRYNTHEVPSGSGAITCDLAYGDDGTRDGRIIFGTLFIVGYLLPLAIIAVFSVLILRYIAQHRQPSVDKGRSASRKKQASRLIVLVVVIFALLWLPVHIYILGCYFFEMFCQQTEVAMLTQSIAYFNSCVNPIIYNSTSKDFRDCFHEVATCGRRRADFVGEATMVAARPSIDLTPGRERQPIIAQGGSSYATDTTAIGGATSNQKNARCAPAPV